MRRSPFHRLTAALGLVLLVLGLASPAKADLFDLQDALLARVDAIEALPAPSKAEKKERAGLAKALKAFDKYAAEAVPTSTKAQKQLAKLAKSVFKSKTGDADVLEGITEVRDCLDEIGLFSRVMAEHDKLLVLDDSKLAKADALIAKGDALRAKALAAWPGNYGKGAKGLTKANKTYAKAAAKVYKVVEDEAEDTPNDLQPTAVSLSPDNLKVNQPVTATVDWSLAEPAAEVTLSVVLSETTGDMSATQFVLDTITMHDVPAGAGSEVIETRIPRWTDRQEVLRVPTPPFGNGTGYNGVTVAADGDVVATTSQTSDGAFGVDSFNVLHVYERVGTNGRDWHEVAVEVTDHYTLGFPPSVAVSGHTIVVGSDDDERVSVYQRDDLAPDWDLATTITPPAGSDIRFGRSLAISGDWIAVGSKEGLHLFRRDQGGAGAWGFVQTLDDGDVGGIGMDTSVTPGLLAFVTQIDFGADGTVALYELDGGSWSLAADLGDGVAVDICGETLAVGDPNATVAGEFTAAGTVQVWERTGAGLVAGPLLTAPNVITDGEFGSTIAVSEDTILAVATNAEGYPDTRLSAYVFARDQDGPDAWGQIDRLAQDDFGFLFNSSGASPVVAASGDVIACGQAPDDETSADAVWILSGMTPVPAGEYLLSLVADPAERLIETLPGAEENNRLVIGAPLTIEADAINKPNLALTHIEVQPDEFYVSSQEGTNVAAFGIDYTVKLEGSFDGPLTGVRLNGEMDFFENPGLNLNADVTFWNSSSNSFEQELELPALYVGDELTLHANLAFSVEYDPGTTGVFNLHLPFRVYKPGLFEYFPVTYEPETSQDEDNYYVLMDQICNVIEIPDATFSESFDKRIGNDDFGAGLLFETSLDLTKDIPGVTIPDSGNMPHELYPGLSEATKGGIASAYANVYLNVLGLAVDFVEFRTLVERDPIDNYGFLGSDLVVLNPFTLSEKVVYAVGPYDTIQLEVDPPDEYPEGVSYEDGTISYEYTGPGDDEWSYGVEVKKEKTFFPGGIPVTVTGKGEGMIGFKLKLEAGNAIVASAGPFATLFGTLDLAVLGGLAGAQGKLTLVDETLRTAAGIGIKEYPEDSGDMAANVCFRVSLEMILLRGQLSVYALYPAVKWCDTFLGEVPCGLRIKKYTKKLIDWAAFKGCELFVDETGLLWCTNPLVCNDDGLGISVCTTDACKN